MKDVLISVLEVITASLLMLGLIFCGCMLFMGSVCKAADTKAIERIIRIEAKKQGFDADLAVAIAKVESNLNPNAKGKANEVGLFQLRPELHPAASFDPATNSRAAISYLIRIRTLCSRKLGPAFILCFNYGPAGAFKLQRPQQALYYKKVTSIYRKARK